MATDTEALIAALKSYDQADEEGVMVLVSRQACDEAAATIATLTKERDAWAVQALKEDDCRKLWQSRALAAESELARLRKANEWQTEAWAVTMDGEVFGVWLNEGAARQLLGSYRRQTKAKWDVERVDITRAPPAPTESAVVATERKEDRS